MSLPDEDRELQRLLDGDGGETAALYRKLSRVEPPRRLDRNVLGEAARAARGHAPRRHRWLVGLSSAAGIVLAAGVAWHVGQDALHQPEPSAFKTAPPAAQQRVYVPVHPFESAPARSEHEATDSAATSAAAAAAPAEPAPELAPAVTKTNTVRARAKDARSQAAPVSPPAPAAPPPPPATAPAPAPTAQAAPAAAAMKTESGGAVRQDIRSSESADTIDAQATRRDSAATTPESLKRSAEIRNDSKLAPDAWIRRIQWLLEQGRDVQARESLNLLRRMHPDVELPDDLKSLQ